LFFLRATILFLGFAFWGARVLNPRTFCVF
jgi:hypothetical protein